MLLIKVIVWLFLMSFMLVASVCGMVYGYGLTIVSLPAIIVSYVIVLTLGMLAGAVAQIE